MTLNEGLLNHIFSDPAKLTENSGAALITWGCVFLVLFTSYLLGSINSAVLFSRLIYKDDIRKHGSGNGGMTNMLRTFGGKAALLTLAGDLGKTAVSIFIAGFTFGFRYGAGMSTSGFCYIAGLFAVLGHVFPLYYKFKGGKGVLVTSTMALILTPLPFLILFCVFAAIFAASHFVSLGSVSVAMLYPVVLSGYYLVAFERPLEPEIAIATIALACLIVWCHRENLQRISEGKEKKTYLKKSNKTK